MCKRAITFFLCLAMTICCAIPAFAEDLSTPDDAFPEYPEPESKYLQDAEALYDQALALYEEKTGYSSFYGNCGTFISYQLHELGIDDYLGGYNGNQWYDAYENGETFGDFTALKYEGDLGVRTLLNSYESLSYVLISYPHQTGYTDENPGAGHAVLLYHISDGLVYFTESYAMYGQKEGVAHAWEIDRLLDTYESWYGTPIGAVWFSDGTDEPSFIPRPPQDGAHANVSFPDNGILQDIEPGTDVEAFLSAYEAEDEAFLLRTATGEEAADDGIVCTGMILCRITEDEEEHLLLAVRGDVDGDGHADTTDARLVLRMAVGLSESTVQSLIIAAGDLNNDGSLTTADARLLLRNAVHLSE